MAAEREPPTATDYVVTALSPVLVMLMVGSLSFFLVEVLYEGKYSGRLIYTLFFFVIGAVLVARIAIETDAGRASLYGLLLGIVTYLALLSYVEYPGGGWLARFGWLVNLGLLVLIWWSAHKLTWDCTHIDEKKKGGGRGLLSAAGLEGEPRKPEPGSITAAPGRDAQTATAHAKKKKPRKSRPDSRLWDWIEAYQKHREKRRKGPHTPGVWVLYFSLGALTLFALGQSLIDPDDEARRRATFLQMAVFIGSALMLLVTTSLLGLRRYLRQRRAKIPTALAGGWLALGLCLVAVFLLVGAFLPRPHSEVPWFGIVRAGKADRESSRHALRKDGASKGEGASGDKSRASDGSAGGKGGKPGGGNTGSKGGGKGQDGKGGSGKEGKSGSGDKKGEGEGNRTESKAASESRDEDRPGGDAADADGRSEGGSRDRGAESSPQVGAVAQKIIGALKWVVFAIIAVAVVVAIALMILRYLAPFTGWAQRLLDAIRGWWAGLWGRAGAYAQKAETDALPLAPERPPPFHAFSNPFADGSAEGREPAELVAFTFLALDSWAWDRDAGRKLPETPLEFIARLADQSPELIEAFTPFARVYTRVTYSAASPPADTLPAMEAVWEAMIHGVASRTET